jgi:hypothetical protein
VNPTPLSDDDLIDAFRSCTLLPAQFDHRAHLRVAWILVRRLPLADAIEQVCTGIENIATHFGAPDKFNRTMSEALVRWIASRATPELDFDAFLAEYPVLTRDVRALLSQHYSCERLTSPEAKRTFVMPDREPLPYVE